MTADSVCCGRQASNRALTDGGGASLRPSAMNFAELLQDCNGRTRDAVVPTDFNRNSYFTVQEVAAEGEEGGGATALKALNIYSGGKI